jgi:hypothetical protein
MTLLIDLYRRRTRAAGRTRRRCHVEVGSLEGRALLSGPGDTSAPMTAAFVSGVVGQDDANTLSTLYKVNGGPVAGGNAVSPTNDGANSVSSYSTGPAGNVEASRVRIGQASPVITAFASPTTLWPPNHKLVPVTVTGHVADNFSGVVPTLSYNTVDEYGQLQPSGTARVDSNGNYSFMVRLQSSRLGQDKDGRLYTILVTATDQAGNTTTAMTSVVVPHDQGNHSGNGEGGIGRGNRGNHGHGHGNGGDGTVVVLPPGQSAGLNLGGDNGKGGKDKHGHGKGNGGGGRTVVVPPGQSAGLNQGGSDGQDNSGDHGNGNSGDQGNGKDGQDDGHGNGNNGQGHGHG